MKILLLLFSVVSFLGIFLVHLIQEGQFLRSIFSLVNFLILFLIIIGIGIWKFIQYKNSIYYLIHKNVKELNQQIDNNNNDIKILKEKITDTKQKLFSLGTIDKAVKEVTENNISLWEEQMKIHHQICNLCQQRISSLFKRKDELDLIYFLVKQIKSEPNADKKLEKLTQLITEIDDKVNLRINKEIKRLIRDLKTDVRKDKIIELQAEITNLESIAV